MASNAPLATATPTAQNTSAPASKAPYIPGGAFTSALNNIAAGKAASTPTLTSTPQPSVQVSTEVQIKKAPKKKSQPPEAIEVVEVDRCQEGAASNMFKVLEDPTGVIVTGTAQQIELAVRLTEDIDIPTKQVLAEVFLVEVQKNWARTIETKIGRDTYRTTPGSATAANPLGAQANPYGLATSSGSVSQIVDAASLVTSKGISGMQGKFSASNGDITAFINLLETNSVGRNISSPTLIAKNGEEAEITKVVTLRKTVQTVVNAAVTGSIAQPALPNQQVQKLDVPLKLKIKPFINQHNKHVTLKFEYEETTLNPEAADTPI
jgi:type II secretory pathway component GspD/PulD (secretin)